MHGDCLERMKEIPDGSIDLIVTDPPYEVQTTGGGSINKVKYMGNSLSDLTKSNIDKGYDIPLFGVEFLRVLKEPNIYIYMVQ
jgi:DNA modification methylase